jgi:hypothetical protein
MDIIKLPVNKKRKRSSFKLHIDPIDLKDEQFNKIMYYNEAGMPKL